MSPIVGRGMLLNMHILHKCMDLVFYRGVAGTTAFVGEFARSKTRKSQRTIYLTTNNELRKIGK